MEIINVVGKYRSGSWYQRNQNKITKLTIHHSAVKQDGRQTDHSVLSALQAHHESQGWPGLSYHFAIMPNGNIYQINNFTDITWHDTINDDSLGILVHGYFHPDVNDTPTDAQLKSLKELLDWLCTANPQFPADEDDVVAHRERSNTACPGNTLYPYVKEYRDKKGDVDWVTDCSKIQKELEEWKARANKREKIIEEMQERIDRLEEQVTRIPTLEDTILQLTEQNKEYNNLLTDMEKSLKEVGEINLALKNQVKDLEAKLGSQDPLSKYTNKELIEYLFNRIFRGGKGNT